MPDESRWRTGGESSVEVMRREWTGEEWVLDDSRRSVSYRLSGDFILTTLTPQLGTEATGLVLPIDERDYRLIRHWRMAGVLTDEVTIDVLPVPGNPDMPVGLRACAFPLAERYLPHGWMRQTPPAPRKKLFTATPAMIALAEKSQKDYFEELKWQNAPQLSIVPTEESEE